jgi:DNA-binding transcriptional regulator PaaX
MEKETREIIKLTMYEILKTLAEGAAIFAVSFEKDWKKKREFENWLAERKSNRSGFNRKIYYLKQKGYIRRFYEGKEAYIELTEKGKERFAQAQIEHMEVPRPKRWDKKWRIIIFDIPEKKKEIRNAIRRKLYQTGFVQVQKSVFIHPFECTTEVNLICNYFGGRKYFKYMIAEILEGEESVIEEFIDKEVLSLADLE